MNLPTDREKALAKIAGGWGREATAAHPLCTCGKQPLPPAPPLIASNETWQLYRAECRRILETACPMHPHRR